MIHNTLHDSDNDQIQKDHHTHAGAWHEAYNFITSLIKYTILELYQSQKTVVKCRMLCLSGSTRNASIPIGQRVILDKITVQSPFKCPKTNEIGK